MPLAELEAVTDRMLELEEELRDLALVVARGLTEQGNMTSLDDVLHRYGITREQLEAIPDD